MGEAINGIVKHFHKPEKEVRDGSLDRPQHAALLFITNEEKQRSALPLLELLSNRGLCGVIHFVKAEVLEAGGVLLAQLHLLPRWMERGL